MQQNEASIELLLVVFEDQRRAVGLFRSLQKSEKRGEIQILDSAVLRKNLSGKTKVQEAHDLQALPGSAFGMLIGGLIGFLGGPAGALAGALFGAAMGGAVAGAVDLGFSDDFLAQTVSSMTPGYSGVLVLIERKWANIIIKLAGEHGGQVLHDIFRKS